jgi:N-acetylglucosamine kinase-like BadF-type ATPase
MIRYLIGIDGGGTKTRMICVDRSGNLVAEALTRGTYYRQDSIATVIDRLQTGLCELTSGIDPGEAAICFGMPGYGEWSSLDKSSVAEIAAFFAPLPIYFVNDAVIGWAGAFALDSGVSLVAGTGSIAYGRDLQGREARCGGWSEYFSDEGSGYWLGKRALELFSKQSDGRVPRGRLYEEMRQHFRVEQDYDIISIVEREIATSREKTAALQLVLLKAAKDGDESARFLYAEAVRELARILSSVASQLDFPDGHVPVSCTGGLSQIQDFVLEPLIKNITTQMDADFFAPRFSPCAGAVLLAVQKFLPNALPDALDKVKAGLQKWDS